MKKLLKVLKYIGLSILILLAVTFAYIFIQSKVFPDKVPSLFGYKPFIVLSGSMETELYKGDLAIVKRIDPKELKVQDIIAFREEKNRVVTHRIVEINTENGEVRFTTKGDNNNKNDDGFVKFDQVEGRYVCKIKGLGSVVLVMQKPLTLITILGLIVIFGVLWIVLGNNKLSAEERKELDQLRKEKAKKK